MHGKVSAALAILRTEIAEQAALATENKNPGEDGQEELLRARRELAAELREDLRRLGEEEEEHQEQGGQWVDYEGSIDSETELVILGLGTEYDDFSLAAILGGGLKIRWITVTGRGAMEVFVAYHKKEDATEGLATAASDITRAGGPRTSVTRARFKADRHSHEANMNGPQPRYKPYPTSQSAVTGMWTDYGHDDEEYKDEGVWKDYSKIDKWTTREWKTSITETNSSTGASSSTTYADADPEEARARKRARGA
jgi:hypothetical protein